MLASIRGSAIAADADARRSNFPRHIDDLRRFQTTVYPLEQQMGIAVADVAPLLRDKPDVIEYHRKAYTGS